jgi:hypothetical protein
MTDFSAAMTMLAFPAPIARTRHPIRSSMGFGYLQEKFDTKFTAAPQHVSLTQSPRAHGSFPAGLCFAKEEDLACHADNQRARRPTRQAYATVGLEKRTTRLGAPRLRELLHLLRG